MVLESAGLGPSDEAARATLAERNAAWARRLREEGVVAFMDWWETLPLFATQRDLPSEARAAIRAEREAHSAKLLARLLEAWGATTKPLKRLRFLPSPTWPGKAFRCSTLPEPLTRSTPR